MKTINDKDVLDRVLRRVLYEMNLTKAEFCRRAGIGTQNLNNWINREKIPPENYPVISQIIGKTVNWMLYGTDSFEPKGLLDFPMGNNSEDEFAHIPQYQVSLSAGHGSYVPEYERVTDRLSFKVKWLIKRGLKAENLVVLYVDGDSMTDRICDGDVVLVDTSNKRLTPSAIFAVNYNKMALVKRITFTPNLTLHSDNPDKTIYPDIPINESSDFEIIGRVVWVGGDI